MAVILLSLSLISGTTSNPQVVSSKKDTPTLSQVSFRLYDLSRSADFEEVKARLSPVMGEARFLYYYAFEGDVPDVHSEVRGQTLLFFMHGFKGKKTKLPFAIDTTKPSKSLGTVRCIAVGKHAYFYVLKTKEAQDMWSAYCLPDAHHDTERYYLLSNETVQAVAVQLEAYVYSALGFDAEGHYFYYKGVGSTKAYPYTKKVFTLDGDRLVELITIQKRQSSHFQKIRPLFHITVPAKREGVNPLDYIRWEDM